MNADLSLPQHRVAYHPVFAGRIDMSGGPEACWPCRVGKDQKGYARVRWQGRSWRGHRLANYIATGQLPEATCHSCDNPPCVNPAHLWSGTKATNTADMWAKGRQRCAQAKLRREQAAAIRAAWRHGGGQPGQAQALADTFGVSPRTVYRIVYVRATTPKCYQPERLAAAA